MNMNKLISELVDATDLRLFVIAECFQSNGKFEDIHDITKVDIWFLYKIKKWSCLNISLTNYTLDTLTKIDT